MPEIMTLKDVAEYLRINERTVAKLAQEGRIPSLKVASQWRFSKEAIDNWFTSQMRRAVQEEQTAERPDLSALITPEMVNLDLKGCTKDEVLSEMADLVVEAGVVKSGRRLLEALVERERLCSTGIGRGTAFLHPRRVISEIVSRAAVAFGRSVAGVDFDAVDGQPVHFFFLDCATSERMHLSVLARLSRVLSDGDLLEKLDSAASGADVVQAVRAAEDRIIAS